LALSLGAVNFVHYRVAARVASRAAPLSVPSGLRLLVVAPHPDDEVLGAGVLIQRVLASGGEVRVVLVTNGDAYRAAGRKVREKAELTFADYRALGELRQKEAWRAGAALGLRPADIISLGFPDKGLAVLWGEQWDRPYRSPATGASAVPYPESYLPGAPYEGKELVHLLREIMRTFRPHWVVAPGVGDLHPDHQATSLFVRLVWTEEQKRRGDGSPLLLEYVIHRRSWHLEPWRENLIVLRPGETPSGRWARLDPTEEEKRAKRRALLEYESQMRVMAGFLLPFASRSEWFQVESSGVGSGL
jgi:LmbE family N-acetylglucosaminyl deacetylase